MNIPAPIRTTDTLTPYEAHTLAPALVALLNEAIGFEQEAFDGPAHIDLSVNGGDTVEWLGEFRERVRAALGTLALPPIPAAEYEAEYGPADDDDAA